MFITLRNSLTPEALADEIARNLRVYKETNANRSVLLDIENTQELVDWLIWHLQCLKRAAEQNQESASVKEIYLKVDEALKIIRTELDNERWRMP